MNLERLAYACTVFLSSTLLFLLQPIVARAILPSFGGAAAVWTTCMLFFQAVLLLGYLYAHLLNRSFSPRMQLVVHTVVVVFSASMLRLGSTSVANGTDHPLLRILTLLQVAVGPAYFVLSTTSPLVQSWMARSTPGSFPYKLFALSNAASLIALVSYPLLWERWLKLQDQIATWRKGYLLYAGIVLLSAWLASRHPAVRRPHEERAYTTTDAFVWILLAFCPAVLWLAVSNHLSQSVAAIPFLWVLPLSLYLFSFVLTFESERWYQARIFRWVLPVAWAGMVLGLFGDALHLDFKLQIAINAASLFVICIFCHGELSRRKPASHSLTAFYLWVAFGGAMGSVFVALLAPVLFRQYLEFPLAIALAIVLGAIMTFGIKSRAMIVRIAVTVGAAMVATVVIDREGSGSRVEARNFYGALRVVDQGESETAYRALFNGAVLHGMQWLSPTRSRWTTTYYGPESAVGKLLAEPGRRPMRVGVIGLGVGTVAGYGISGDVFRFYEINPLVTAIAHHDFRYLAECPGVVEVIEGDARVRLERESPNAFDVLVVDAFSGDSIPVHLLTREAFQVYRRHLAPGGRVAVHISNKYLDLGGVVGRVAESAGMTARLYLSSGDLMRRTNQARWVVVTAPGREPEWGQPVRVPLQLALWTDDFHDLLQVLQ